MAWNDSSTEAQLCLSHMDISGVREVDFTPTPLLKTAGGQHGEGRLERHRVPCFTLTQWVG